LSLNGKSDYIRVYSSGNLAYTICRVGFAFLFDLPILLSHKTAGGSYVEENALSDSKSLA